MEDSLTKVKNKVKSAIHRKSADQSNLPDSRYSEYLSQKPLPASPQHHVGTSQPTVRQVNAFSDNYNESTGNSTPSPSTSDKIPSQYLLPEIHLDRLGIGDPNDTVHVAQEPHPTKSPSGGVTRSPKKSSKTSQSLAADLTDADELSRKIKSEPNTLSSTIPGRRSSKNFESHRGDPVVDFPNLVNPPSAEKAVRRKRLSPTAQLPPGFNLSNTVDTSVDTTQAPAVTHEVKHKHTEEIIHEQIARDIHVDHYYNYVQPIKEVIIKPAVHFTIDERGDKVRIPTPDCWEPPSGFTPTLNDSDREAKLAEMVRGVRDSFQSSKPEE